MTGSIHVPTKLMKAQGGISSGQAVNLGDTTANDFVAGIITAGAGMPLLSSTGAQYIADLVTTPNTNVELSYAGYARQSLTSVTWAFDATLGVIDWSFGNLTWAQNSADPGTGRYVFFAWKGVGSSDATYPLVMLFDPNGTGLLSVAAASLTLISPTGGPLQFTGGG